jgi:hypothetical protein
LENQEGKYECDEKSHVARGPFVGDGCWETFDAKLPKKLSKQQKLLTVLYQKSDPSLVQCFNSCESEIGNILFNSFLISFLRDYLVWLQRISKQKLNNTGTFSPCS